MSKVTFTDFAAVLTVFLTTILPNSEQYGPITDKLILRDVPTAIAGRRNLMANSRLYDLPRKDTEVRTNDYNIAVPLAWTGNSDLQFVGENSAIIGRLCKGKRLHLYGTTEACNYHCLKKYGQIVLRHSDNTEKTIPATYGKCTLSICVCHLSDFVPGIRTKDKLRFLFSFWYKHRALEKIKMRQGTGHYPQRQSYPVDCPRPTAHGAPTVVNYIPGTLGTHMSPAQGMGESYELRKQELMLASSSNTGITNPQLQGIHPLPPSSLAYTAGSKEVAMVSKNADVLDPVLRDQRRVVSPDERMVSIPYSEFVKHYGNDAQPILRHDGSYSYSH